MKQNLQSLQRSRCMVVSCKGLSCLCSVPSKMHFGECYVMQLFASLSPTKNSQKKFHEAQSTMDVSMQMCGPFL